MLPLLILVESTGILAALHAATRPLQGTLAQILTIMLCHVIAFYYNDLYDFGMVRSFSDFLARLPRAFAWWLILMTVSWGLVPEARIPAVSLAAAFLAILAVLLPARAAIHALLCHRALRERVLILGAGPMAALIRKEIETRPFLRLDVVGFAGGNADSAARSSCAPWLGGAGEIERIIDERSPHRIIVALSERRGGIPVLQLVEMKLDGIAVEDGEEFYERVTGKIILESVSPSSFVFGRPTCRMRVHLGLARAASMAVSAAGLALTAPLFPMIGLAIRLDSPGPIFFVQDRVGRRGRRYRMLKFRTMRPVERESSAWAGDNGYRITRVGGLLRKFRLDELPQFVNILLGDMNLVGPRPHPASNLRLFADRIPHYELRLAVRPGVTGWAQTRYWYANNLEEETEKVRYDLYYIKHLSTWLDLRILFDTIKVVLLGRRSDMTHHRPDTVREDTSAGVHDTAA